MILCPYIASYKFVINFFITIEKDSNGKLSQQLTFFNAFLFSIVFLLFCNIVRYRTSYQRSGKK